MENPETLFNSIVSRYSERLYWHVRGMVGSHEDADDLMQEIFVKVWKALPGFRGDSEVYTWLWRIATNEALNFLRKQRLRAGLSFGVLDETAEKIADPSPMFDSDKALVSLRKAIMSLPPRQRSVFCMRYYEELPYEQIADITGTSVGSLKASYHFAFEKVKKYLVESD